VDFTWRVSDCEELVWDENSTASREHYAHLSGEEILDTGAAISKKLYG